MNKTAAYFDHAAATPVDAEVLEAMQPYFSEHFHNPSALYAGGREARNALEKARASIAAILGSRPSEIIFTAGGTEANNLAIAGVMSLYPHAKVLVSAIEHESVLEPAKRYTHELLAIDERGVLAAQTVASRIGEDTVLISVMLANNEIGSLQPLKELAELVRHERQARLRSGNDLPLLLHTDAAQAANYLDIHTARLGVDMMSLNGGKIYGPKQSGALYVKAGTVLQPLLRGGGQEYGLRSGTENVASTIGFAVALQKAQAMRKDESERLEKLKNLFMSLVQAELPEAQLTGPKKHRLPNNLHYSFAGLDNERLVMRLDNSGVMAATGSACSASSDEPSHVLRALGVPEERIRGSVRFTMGRTTDERDVRRAVAALKDAVTAEKN